MVSSPEVDQIAPARLHSWAFLRRPGWLATILGGIAFALLCWLVLAPWQFGRNTERTTHNDAIHTALASAPVPVSQLLSPDREPLAEHAWRTVTAQGTFLPGQVFVRLRQDNAGNPASEVLARLRLTDGTLLLVDRGYVPDASSTGGAAPPGLPTGVVTLTGRIQPDQPDPSHRDPVDKDGNTLVYGIESVPRLAGLSGTKLQGFIQLKDGTPAALSEIGVPQTDDGPYLSYALQWCVFGGVALITVCFFLYREYTDPRPEYERNARAAGPPDARELTERPAAGEEPDRVAAGPAALPDRAPPPRTARRGRDSFDPSELYDSE